MDLPAMGAASATGYHRGVTSIDCTSQLSRTRCVMLRKSAANVARWRRYTQAESSSKNYCKMRKFKTPRLYVGTPAANSVS